MTLPHLNALDGVILTVVGFTLIRGAFRGLVREVMGIVAVGGAYLLANVTYLQVEPGMRGIIRSPMASAGVAYVLAFVGFALTLTLLLRLVDRQVLRLLPMGGLNQAGGLVLGALKGTLVVSVALFLLDTVPEGEDLMDRSLLAPVFLPVAEALGEAFIDALPDEPPAAVVPFVPG